MLPLGVDAIYQMLDAFMPLFSDILQSVPELVFEADTTLATKKFN